MTLTTSSYLVACLKDPGFVKAPRLETYFCGIPGRQTTGHVSLQEISFDFKALHLKQISGTSSNNFNASTLPSPKGNEPSESNRRHNPEPEHFSVVDTVTPAIAVNLQTDPGYENEGSGPIDERQLATGEAIVHQENESNTTYSGDNDESQAVEEEDDEDPHQAHNQVEHPPEKPERPTSDEIIIETRYCIVCNLEQPLRGKHCKECNKCVSLHDHHCPWLGNCVGERNRLIFFWYLVAQTFELWMALFCMGRSLESATSIIDWISVNLLRLGIIGIILFFTVMVTSLLGFHCYLAVSNQTTCEG
mmetsp:Transcript_1541/g.3292  ORF Transcript_1541/g.3292 Transcript_1541/m.3292 type:complete len:305 (+) Transcript_1541:91-1005(+)